MKISTSKEKVLKYLYCSFLNINMTKNLPSLVGKMFDRLTVADHAGKDKGGKALYICKCTCGGTKISTGTDLRAGKVKSCGCIGSSYHPKTHGKRHTPEYEIWAAMKARCYYEKHKDYYNYGGRGITVCDRWLNSFQNFYDDMGDRPSKQHSIDRREVNGHYEPSNCFWATAKEQGRNRRNNSRFTCNGETLCLAEWAERLGIGSSAILSRIERGWTIEKSLTLTSLKSSR